jgi:hypothetical protein
VRERDGGQGQRLISRAGWKEGGKIGWWWCNNRHMCCRERKNSLCVVE